MATVVLGAIVAGSTVWGTFGFPVPATQNQLQRAALELQVADARNKKSDLDFRLDYYNQRRDQLYEARDKYLREGQAPPDWIRRQITRICDKLTKTKKELGLNPSCGD